MGNLFLQTRQKTDFTMLPNNFIDNEMSEANGDFVKVYIYLLRCSAHTPENFSISLIADLFNLTENDVCRALRYWEKKELLTLVVNGSEIVGISINEMPQTGIYKKENVSENNYKYYTPASFNSVAPQIAAANDTHDSVDEPMHVRKSTATAVNAYQTATAMKSEPSKQMDFTSADNSRIKEILIMAETYLKKPLTPDETMKVYYFYDTLHFSPDLIEYLIEYCVSNDKRSMAYIEKVALSWAQKGIKTVSEAKEEGNTHNKDYFTVMKAFGIRDRYPVDNEIEYMNKWLHTYHFDLEIVLEACARTMKKGNQAAPFTYADKIITNWYKNGVVSRQDIATLDALHNQSKAAASQTPPSTSKVSNVNKVSGNSFNNFNQRSTDYDALEEQLSRL